MTLAPRRSRQPLHPLRRLPRTPLRGELRVRAAETLGPSMYTFVLRARRAPVDSARCSHRRQHSFCFNHLLFLSSASTGHLLPGCKDPCIACMASEVTYHMCVAHTSFMDTYKPKWAGRRETSRRLGTWQGSVTCVGHASRTAQDHWRNEYSPLQSTQSEAPVHSLPVQCTRVKVIKKY